MRNSKAIQIVLDLARQNVIDERDNEDMARMQWEAIDQVVELLDKIPDTVDQVRLVHMTEERAIEEGWDSLEALTRTLGITPEELSNMWFVDEVHVEYGLDASPGNVEKITVHGYIRDRLYDTTVECVVVGDDGDALWIEVDDADVFS